MKKLLLLLLIILASSCSRFKELHYFKDSAKPIPNYYRLTIKGHSWFASSRFLSGYFDEEAVDDYFSEITQPEKARFNKRCEINKTTNKIVPVDPILEDKKLVMILSSNSDAIATQIGSFVESKKTFDALGSMLNRNRLEDAQNLIALFEVQAVKGQILLDLGDKLVANMDEKTITKKEAETNLLQYLNALAANLGNPRPFLDLDDAQRWLENNRASLLK